MELPRTAVAVAAPEEVGESPVALVEAAILLRCLLEAGRRSLAAEWASGVGNAGTAANWAPIWVGNGALVPTLLALKTFKNLSFFAGCVACGGGLGLLYGNP